MSTDRFDAFLLRASLACALVGGIAIVAWVWGRV